MDNCKFIYSPGILLRRNMISLVSFLPNSFHCGHCSDDVKEKNSVRKDHAVAIEWNARPVIATLLSVLGS